MPTKYLYQKEISHKGLNKYQIVKAETKRELDNKVRVLKNKWDEEWSRKCLLKAQQEEKIQKMKAHEDAVSYAEELTLSAEKIQEELDCILLNSLEPAPLDINSLKDFSKYPTSKPKKPTQTSIPLEPNRTDKKYNPELSFLVRLFKKRREEVIKQSDEEFNNDWNQWVLDKENIEATYNIELEQYNKKITKWNKDKDTFLNEQNENNNNIDHFMQDYNSGDPNSITEYYSLVLERIDIPIEYNQQFDIEYNCESKMLIIDLFFPSNDELPNLKKVSYIKTKDEFKEMFQSEAYMKKKYDSVIYQIVLQTLNYIFKLDESHDFINSVALNGRINCIDKSTGQNITPCILSINISKENFISLNLQSIDPKTWFKSAKGVSASTFANVTPVAPIITMNRQDKRFVEGYGVAEELNDSVNLAAIDWQDFENLIREIFEQEFNSTGGEVKITQASRDGGVDAIAFDPDPIKGGKIVIQAKRYTNIVGVSFVRDLYGTVMNEGAIKGILVTTSNYGSDAYNFADGKPLTLLNGANLLHLLEKHGCKARIDLKEAKEMLKNDI